MFSVRLGHRLAVLGLVSVPFVLAGVGHGGGGEGQRCGAYCEKNLVRHGNPFLDITSSAPERMNMR
jgi:hypothetical protein